MSGQAHIDSLDFARNARELRGEFDTASLGRLQDCLYDNTGSIAYRLRGDITDRGRPVLEVSVAGELKLRCQRCLGPLEFRVNVARQLVLVGKPAELADPAQEDEMVDSVFLPEPHVDIDTLVEDEILLCLPISPRHAIDKCVPAGLPQPGSPQAESPFAVLAQLQRR